MYSGFFVYFWQPIFLLIFTMKHDNKEFAAGIDIGGTNSVFGLVDSRGNILCRGFVPTEDYADPESFAADISRRLMEMAAHIGTSVAGIGIGAPCANSRTGEIEAATDLPWPSPIPLARMFAAHTGVPVLMGNDANAAAIGEMNYGAARGMRDFILLTLGTGVGSGIICDGHLVDGQRGFAGELGHIRAWRHEGRMCGCGRRDCLQTYCSAKGVVATALRLLESDRESTLKKIPSGKLTSKDVAIAAHEGDALAIETLRFTGDVLGEACAQFAAFTDPEAIILFGGVAHAGEELTSAMEESFDRNALSLYKGKVRFLLSGLSESDSALLGASALGWEAARKN